MQRWEYWVVSFRGQQYTAALNELGREGWELVSIISEAVAAPDAPEKSGAFPMPRAIGRLEDAAGKLTKLGASNPADDTSAGATSRLLWIFRRPLDEE